MMKSNADKKDNANEAYKATQYFARRKVPPVIYYRIRTFLRKYPMVFLPLSRWRWNRWRKEFNILTNGPEPAAPEPVERETDVVIEGFPRMGNTFAHIAFKFAQKEPVKIAHHTHAAAQVIYAAKRNIPTIVLIREPEAAITSYLVGEFDTDLSISQSLREYISFYTNIMPYKDRFLIVEFEDLISDYGAIIRLLNIMFSTSFDEFQHTRSNVNACFELIEKGYQSVFGDFSEKNVCRPSESRLELKEDTQRMFKDKRYSKLNNQAKDLYKSYKTFSTKKLSDLRSQEESGAVQSR